MIPVFADPKTDFVFKRIFGAAERKPLVIALLNHLRYALDVARTASFTPAEWEAYERAKMAEQDARGALAVAHDRARIQACVDLATLDRWVDNVFGAKTATDVLS